ncbi:MAG TPA: hypothetical protein VLL25_05930 [Acidimicrobiales bacterium]|nr:hypothetical protein [Acidimicrobiales bacterium]
MSPIGDAGLETLLARLIELEAHLDSQDRDMGTLDDRLDEIVHLTVQTHAFVYELHSALMGKDEPPAA